MLTFRRPCKSRQRVIFSRGGQSIFPNARVLPERRFATINLLLFFKFQTRTNE